MTLSTQVMDLNELEQRLGDPFDETSPLSYKQAMLGDESETVPFKALEFLQSKSVFDYLVPENLGGKLHSYQHLYHVIRMLSRRDVTLATLYVLRAIGLGPILIQGTEAQKKFYAKQILEGSGISWGVSEREHGSDLINSSSKALKVADGYELSGSKWLIGGASFVDMAMFLARSRDSLGPDSFTMFCVDSRKRKRGEFSRMAREKLHGVRGLDLSGFSLEGYLVGDEDIIGEEGCGLELMLRTAQLHRVGAVTMALGAMDTGLRIAMSFAQMRHIFGKKLAEIPITRYELVDTYCEMLLCELVISSATRALHFSPKEMFLQAAVAKYLVPSFSRQGFARLAGAIGARYFLRENFAYGLFQKAMRDAEMTSFVDGNEKVNLKNISLHMEVTLAYLEKNTPLSDQERENFAAFYNLNAVEPMARFSDLVVFSGRKDQVFMFLADSVERLKTKLIDCQVGQPLIEATLSLATQVSHGVKDLYGTLQLEKNKLKKDFNYSPQSYHLAEQYALLHAAADAIHVAVYTDLQAPMDNLIWLPLCLNKVLRHLGGRPEQPVEYPDKQWVDETYKLMRHQFDEGLAFSLLPLKIAENPRAFCNVEQMNI